MNPVNLPETTQYMTTGQLYQNQVKAPKLVLDPKSPGPGLGLKPGPGSDPKPKPGPKPKP